VKIVELLQSLGFAEEDGRSPVTPAALETVQLVDELSTRLIEADSDGDTM
jgi:hypothetical protein